MLKLTPTKYHSRYCVKKNVFAISVWGREHMTFYVTTCINRYYKNVVYGNAVTKRVP